MKKIIRKLSCIMCAGLLLLACTPVVAQQAQLQVLHDLGGMNADKMAYCYKVFLVNKQSGMVLDSIAGTLYRDRDYYLDSNALVINMRDADYTLQINPKAKTAYVKSVKEIEKKMNNHVAAPNVLFNVEELQKRNITSFRAGKDDDGNMHVQVAFDEPDISEIDATITADRKLARLIMKIPGGGGGKDMQQRVLVMYDFSDSFDASLISVARFMTVNKNTYKLKGKFATCKAQRLI